MAPSIKTITEFFDIPHYRERLVISYDASRNATWCHRRGRQGQIIGGRAKRKKLIKEKERKMTFSDVKDKRGRSKGGKMEPRNVKSQSTFI